MSILATLRGAKTATDYAKSIEDLEFEIAEMEAAEAGLKADQDRAIFEGTDTDVAKAEAAIADHGTRLETLRVALAGAKRRRDEAAKAEEDAEWQRRHAEAKAMQEELRKVYIGLAEHGRAFADLAHQGMKLKAKLDAHNRKVQTAGRLGLVMGSVLSEVAEHFTDGQRQRGADPLCNLLSIPTFWRGSGPVFGAGDGGRERNPAPVEYLGGRKPKPVDL